MGEWGYSSTHS